MSTPLTTFGDGTAVTYLQHMGYDRLTQDASRIRMKCIYILLRAASSQSEFTKRLINHLAFELCRQVCNALSRTHLQCVSLQINQFKCARRIAVKTSPVLPNQLLWLKNCEIQMWSKPLAFDIHFYLFLFVDIAMAS